MLPPKRRARVRPQCDRIIISAQLVLARRFAFPFRFGQFLRKQRGKILARLAKGGILWPVIVTK